MNEPAPMRAAQAAQARRFHDLHAAPELLVLPNAWDAGSAVIFEQAGFRAIGTTSAGIAHGLGQPDGQRIPLAELLAVQSRIVQRIGVPLSVDIETGYGDDPAEVLATVEAVIAGGAVGINIEDGVTAGADGNPRLTDRATQSDLVHAIHGAKEGTGVPFVINARTDGYWLGLGDAEDRLASAIARGNAYLEAGADCVFVPGNLTSEVIDSLVREIDGPLNVIAARATPTPRELADLGVARLSVGSGPARASFGLVRRIARELMQGSFASMRDNDLTYDEANRLFGRPASPPSRRGKEGPT